MTKEIYLFGLPKFQDNIEKATFRYKLSSSVKEVFNEFGIEEANVLVSTEKNVLSGNSNVNFLRKNQQKQIQQKDELTTEERASQYNVNKPLYDFDFLVISKDIKKKIMSALARIRLTQKIFDEWDLNSIEPFPRTALNLYGAPGTGKTVAAHAIASYMERPILIASYAQIESKFHGDGPKNVEALFFAAERDNSVLFIDEADSLLSKRLTDVTQGSEQAINSMRSQLLICLERFKGVVIFATNLVENYDPAFESRVLSIEFETPNEEVRRQIWIRHLPKKLPLEDDISVEKLAKEELSGREIKNAVIEAASNAAFLGQDRVSQSDLLNSIKLVKESRIRDKSQSIKMSGPIKQKLTDYARTNLANKRDDDE